METPLACQIYTSSTLSRNLENCRQFLYYQTYVNIDCNLPAIAVGEKGISRDHKEGMVSL
ncbi:MAG: hypothetical protein CM15mP10_1060 [Actinomycetota bacterium]|nr:MAG: hypothetical protein CM15mP10_1060 [Actinomycetota bacterium]